MPARFVALIIFATFCVMPPVSAGDHSMTSKPSNAALGSAQAAGADQREIEAMKADLQKMRVLLNQMQTNLIFVGNNTSPLNHQFQLEIDMWRLLMDQTERRLQQLEQAGAGRKQ